MNTMSCYVCGEGGEVGVRALCVKHQELCRKVEELQAAAEREKGLREALTMAIDTLELDQEVPRPKGKLEAWVAKYGDVTDTVILKRLRAALTQEGE